MEIQKFEYLDNKKSFLDKIKTIFRDYLRAVIWRKNEKIADTIFKVCLRYIFASLFCMPKIEHF